LGLKFPNPVGLAAGFDKDGDYLDAFGSMGFGFLEVGTVTPRPQPGNPSPRLFRLPEYQALINRMGFNNKGVDHLVERLKSRRYDGIIGVNIGKNKSTPVERAAEDYVHCLKKVYPLADYVTVNVSSPNTPGLRDLQYGDQLAALLSVIGNEQRVLERIFHRFVPVVVKVAPDLDDQAIEFIAKTVVAAGLQGVIATNTTSDKSLVVKNRYWQQEGGLSGQPIIVKADRVLRKMRQALPNDQVVIGVGGIVEGSQAAQKISHGADLVQVYTGLIYAGPCLVRDCVSAIIASQQASEQVLEGA
jgi:dihydroorotate dehydrogenase subfamily 2